MSDDVVVVFADVGQGDCTVIIDRATGDAMIVDCPAGSEDVAASILDMFEARLHTAVITHFDDDHSAGLVSLINELGASQVLMRAVEHEKQGVIQQYKQLLAAMQKYGFEVISADVPKSLAMGRCRWHVLGPSGALQLNAASRTTFDRNRTSVVVRVDIEPAQNGATAAVLLAGDCDRTAWLDLLTRASELRAHMFRWPHHGAQIAGLGLTGSGSALSDDVLNAVDPEIVFMGVGSTNQYGHPDLTAVASVRQRSGTTHYCSQVTSACAAAAVASGTQCAGHLTVTVSSAGDRNYDRSKDEQKAFASNWATPHCLVDVASLNAPTP